MNISNYSYHPSNDTTPRATPSRSLTRAPTEGEIRSAILGPEKCPHLEDRGGFRVWDLNNLYRGVTIEPGDFNCFAWSVGHTDRWLEGGSVADMNDLYEEYKFEQCSYEEAEVDVLKIIDAPEIIRNPRGREYRNPLALVLHAQRRDHPNDDRPPHLGCSSKQNQGGLWLHNRHGQEDTRPWGSRRPPIKYGSIYQHWVRTPEHPSFPGMEHNIVPPTGNHPQNAIFAYGYGSKPPGHKGNNIGLPKPPPGYDDPSGPSGSGKNVSYSRRIPRGMPQRHSKSGKIFAKVPYMGPYDPIPSPSRSSCDSALRTYEIVLQQNHKLVEKFEAYWRAWKGTWRRSDSPNARNRCYVEEYNALIALGPRVLPLLIYKLTNPRNWTGLFLYIDLEQDTRYCVDRHDILNYRVLQRHANLLVDINYRRQWR